MKGRREHYVIQYRRYKKDMLGKNRLLEMDTIASKVLPIEKEEFYRICFNAKITPSKVLRIFVRSITNLGKLSNELLSKLEILQEAERMANEENWKEYFDLLKMI